MDFNLMCAAKEITNVVENQDLFTEAAGLYLAMHRGKAKPNHYPPPGYNPHQYLSAISGQNAEIAPVFLLKGHRMSYRQNVSRQT